MSRGALGPNDPHEEQTRIGLHQTVPEGESIPAIFKGIVKIPPLQSNWSTNFFKKRYRLTLSGDVFELLPRKILDTGGKFPERDEHATTCLNP
jgi:hypothetical protein